MNPRSKDPYDKLRYDFEDLAKEVVRQIPVAKELGAGRDVEMHTDKPHGDSHTDKPHEDHIDWGYHPADERVRYPDLRVLSEIVSTLQRLDERLTKLEAAQGKKSRPSR